MFFMVLYFKCSPRTKVRIIYYSLKYGSSSPSGEHYEYIAYPVYSSKDNKSDYFLYKQLFSPLGSFRIGN